MSDLTAQVAAELANPTGGPAAVQVSNGDLSDPAVRDELRAKVEAMATKSTAELVQPVSRPM